MPQVIASRLIRKLEELKRELPPAVAKTMNSLGERMKIDITTYAAFTYSPSWQRAIHQNGPYAGSPYFMQRDKLNEGGSREEFGYGGIMDAIEKNQVMVSFADNVVHLGFGQRSVMDSAAPYWRLFEDEDQVPGARYHGSLDHQFVPSDSYGKTGEGYSRDETDTPEISYKRFKAVYSNPGFYPVRLFGDTQAHYQYIARQEIIKSMKTVIRTIAL